MEGAGVWEQSCIYIVIKGVCDYADSSQIKNDRTLQRQQVQQPV